MEKEKVFADGFIFKRNEKAPDFVVGRVSVKVDEAIAFLRKHEKSGWVNLDVKTARTGNFYMELDTFEPKGGSNPQASSPKKADDSFEDVPF